MNLILLKSYYYIIMSTTSLSPSVSSLSPLSFESLSFPTPELEDPSDLRPTRIFLATIKGQSVVQRKLKQFICREQETSFITPAQLNTMGMDTDDTHIDCTKEDLSIFLRDCSLTLFESQHLIPYSLAEGYDLLGAHLNALLPDTAFHHLKPDAGMTGKGFEKVNTDHIREAFQKFNIPFNNGSSCIEGGNAYLFSFKGKKYAIVGEISLYLTLIALEEQGAFDSLSIDEEIQLSPYHIRAARNLEEYDTIKNDLKILGAINTEEEMTPELKATSHRIFAIIDSWTQPVPKDLFFLYEDAAKSLASKIQFTEEVIAKEIGIPQTSITFIPTKYYHLDMGMLITPEGEVIRHDDTAVGPLLDSIEEDALEEDTPLKEAEQKLYTTYRIHAEQSAEELADMDQMTDELLEADGFTVHRMPMVFHANGKKSGTLLNYCNGVFVKNPEQKPPYIFITNGPSTTIETKVHKKFIELFQSKFPHIMVKTVLGMSEFLAKNDGGIHCLTFEDRLIYGDYTSS